MQAESSAASVMPTTGTLSISRSAFSPVSYDTAITTASQSFAWRAASTTAACSAIACSLRVATIAAPKSAVAVTISVPGEATRRASAAAVCVTKSVVLALRTRMRMTLSYQTSCGAMQRAAGTMPSRRHGCCLEFPDRPRACYSAAPRGQ